MWMASVQGCWMDGQEPPAPPGLAVEEGAPEGALPEEGWSPCCWLPFLARLLRRSAEDCCEFLELEHLASGRSADWWPPPEGLPPESSRVVEVKETRGSPERGADGAQHPQSDRQDRK